MNSDTVTVSVDNDGEIFLKKFVSFKEEYLKMRKLYVESLEEKKIMQNKLRILESRLKLEESNSTSKTIRQQQEEIIRLLKKKEDYVNLQNSYDVLQQKVQHLETELETDRCFYEQEIRNIIANSEKEIIEIRRASEILASEKISKMEMDFKELNKKNDELNIVLETINVETQNELARVDSQCKEEIKRLKDAKIRLEAENKILVETLLQQQPFCNQKLQEFENQRHEYYKHVLKLDNRRNFSGLQTLDEAFSANERRTNFNFRNDNNEIKSKHFNSNSRLLTPCVTDEQMIIN